MGRRHEAAGAIHHVFARGAKKMPIFYDDFDRRMYLASLGHVVQQQGWHLLAYCLMDNHVHLIVETPKPNLGEGMYWHHGPYAVQFNRRHNMSGHVFQGRYRAKRIWDDGQFWNLVHYVDQNPVAAELCARPEDYRWASAGAIAGRRPPKWLATKRLREHRQRAFGPTPRTGAPG